MTRNRSSSACVAERPAERPLGKYERLAYERSERDHRDGHLRGLWFDEEAADHIVEFFERHVRHFEGEWDGQPIHLEPEQKFILREVFGWKRANGTRRFRTALVEVSRKWGKSFLGGGVGLYLEGPDQEPGAQVYAAATKEEQARIVHDAAKNIVLQDKDLSQFFTVLAKSITCPTMGSTFKPLGANSKTQDGFNAHGAIIDEIHAHTDRRVWMKLKTSMGARRQPLIFIITTAGVYDPESIGWEQHEDATKVLEGVFDDDTLFAYIAAADEEDDWTLPSSWWKANPNLGISVKWDYVGELCEEAKRRPSFENEFRQMYCNQWVEQVRRWLPMDKWNSRCGGLWTPEEWNLAERICYAGLDLSDKQDMTAYVLLFPPTEEDPKHRLLCRFWVPEDRITEAVQHGRVPYKAWKDAGFLIPTPGDVIDYAFVRKEINELAVAFPGLQEIAFDPYHGWQTSLELADDGFTMAETRMGAKSMGEPSAEFERLVVSGGLAHGDNPVLRWMASNVTIRYDANKNIMPDKDKSTAKIDGIVAAILALGRSIVHREETSVYEDHDLRVL